MVSAGPLSGFIGFWLAPCLVLCDFGWPPVFFYGISKLAGFSMVSAGTPSGFMGFRLAPCLVLWDFGWPSVWFYGISKLTDAPVPISNPSPRPRAPWIELRRALAWFRLAPCLVLWAFKTDGWPLSRSQSFPHAQELLGLSCGWLSHMVSAGTLSGFMGFRLAPCLVLWDFKTDGWPLSRSQSLPHAQELLGLSCGWL